MKRHRVILDTNVILAALRSQAGASHRLLMTIGHPQWQSVVTPALMYETTMWSAAQARCQGFRATTYPPFSTSSTSAPTGNWSISPGDRFRPIPAMTWSLKPPLRAAVRL
jgi:hypothetical protein